AMRARDPRLMRWQGSGGAPLGGGPPIIAIGFLLSIVGFGCDFGCFGCAFCELYPPVRRIPFRAPRQPRSLPGRHAGGLLRRALLRLRSSRLPERGLGTRCFASSFI